MALPAPCSPGSRCPTSRAATGIKVSNTGANGVSHWWRRCAVVGGLTGLHARKALKQRLPCLRMCMPASGINMPTIFLSHVMCDSMHCWRVQHACSTHACACVLPYCCMRRLPPTPALALPLPLQAMQGDPVMGALVQALTGKMNELFKARGVQQRAPFACCACMPCTTGHAPSEQSNKLPVCLLRHPT